jgi:RecA-family ATPase
MHQLDLQLLAATEPLPPRHIVPDWVPAGEVTLFAGHGGSGKSSVALTLAVCVAAGRAFHGLPVQQRRVAFVSLEDPKDVIHWRLARLCAWLGVDMGSLAGHLLVLDGSGGDGALMVDTRDGPGFTTAYFELERRLGGRSIIIDGASDAFAANENDRSAVRRFVRGLRRLIGPDDFLMLLAHVDKATARSADTSQGYSGSTAWSNSARARWYLRTEADSEDLLLEVQKANHAPAGAKLRLSWNAQAHVFVADLVQPTTKLERELAESDERAGILAAFRSCARAGIAVPAAMQGPRTAYHVLSLRPEFPASLAGGNRAATSRFREQIERLRQSRSIVEGSIRRANRHSLLVLVIPQDGCANVPNS